MKKGILTVSVFFLSVIMMAGLSGCNGDPTVQDDPSGEMKTVRDAVTNQKYCPVMEGMQVNRDIYVDHDGKRVYFCCAGCIGAFESDPETYLEKVKEMHAADEGSNPGHDHGHNHGGCDHDHSDCGHSH